MAAAEDGKAPEEPAGGQNNPGPPGPLDPVEAILPDGVGEDAPTLYTMRL